MKKLSNLLLLSLIPIFISFMIGTSIKAATTANVDATVTVQNISISLSTDGAVAYGTLDTNSSQDTTTNGINDSETVSNDSNVSVDLNIKGADTTAWTLAATTGTENQYVHKFCTTTCDSSPTWTALQTTDQTLVAGLGASPATQDVDLQITTPSSTTSYDTQTASVTITAVAAGG